MSVIASYYAYTLEEQKKWLNDPENYISKRKAECDIDRSYAPLLMMLVNGEQDPVKDNIFSLGLAGWYDGYEIEYPDFEFCRWDAWGGHGFLDQATVKKVADAFASVDIESKVYSVRAFSVDSLIHHFNNLRDFYQLSARNDCFVEMFFM